MKLVLIKFLVGGFAVLISYIVSVVLPWKEFGGIFATFPAVFLVSMFITGMQFGDKVAMHVSRGAVFGMIGVLFSILATWGLLQATQMWLVSIIGGFVVWFVSALVIFEMVEFIFRKRRDKHGWKTERSTINKKIYDEINRLLETTHFRDITIDQISENTGISKATIYRRWKDKASIIMDMFVEQSHKIFIDDNGDLYEDLFQF